MSEPIRPEWLLLGAGGQVGRELCRALQPLGQGVALTRAECDLSVPGAAEEMIARYEPGMVVNAAAYTAVDRAEEEPALARRINAEAVAEIAQACARHDMPLVHYSTDYVFDGSGEAPFAEHDATGPLGEYGRSKLAGEQAIADAGGRSLVLRTSWVYAAHGRNFVRTMLRLAAERDHLRIIDDQVGAPTWAATIADVTALALFEWRRQAWDAQLSGVYHLSASDSVSWCGFAQAIFEEAANLGLLEATALPSVEAIPSSAYPQPARRPLNSRLSTQRLQTAFGLATPHWREALRVCLTSMRA